MQEKTVQVGIFWAVPQEGGWDFYEIKKAYSVSAANESGFVDYPFSHYDKWDDVRSADETPDCYYYPRGRVLYNAKQGKHRIFADGCLNEFDLAEIIERYEITDYELLRDCHYVSAFTHKADKKTAPVLTYEILRGKDKIGENLIQVTYGGAKILLELGKALDGGGELSELEQSVIGGKYNGVIVSHYHADHAGLIKYKKDCPVYIGGGAYRIIKANNDYHGEETANNICTYRNGRPFYVGGIKVTPYLCDHSAFDSYMLLIEAGGRSILYTGDFRFHGRKGRTLLSQLPKKVNTLICEGTNEGGGKPCMTESELEERAVEIMKTDKPVFIMQSASNIDRLVSFYRAAKRSGRIFYEDNYAALIASAAGGKIPRPDVFGDVYAFTPKMLRGRRKDMFFEFENKRGINQIAKNAKFAMLVRPSMLGYLQKLADRTDLYGATLIYSVWSGYKEDGCFARFLNGVRDLNIDIKTLHTSGHASACDIRLLKQTVCADEYVTVHTSAPLNGGSGL